MDRGGGGGGGDGSGGGGGPHEGRHAQATMLARVSSFFHVVSIALMFVVFLACLVRTAFSACPAGLLCAVG